jgi:hypothetical protein
MNNSYFIKYINYKDEYLKLINIQKGGKVKKKYTAYLTNYFIKDTPNILKILKDRKIKVEDKWVNNNKKKLQKYHFIFYHKIGSIKWNDIHSYCRLINYLQLSIPLSNKKSMYEICLKNKKLLKYVPKTFFNVKRIPSNIKYIISKGVDDTGGKGIIIQKNKNIKYIKNHIYQEYISNPLLLDGLKFDFRMYVFLNYDKKLYLYPRFIIRRSRYPYTLNTLDQRIHLTNSSIQYKSEKRIGNIKSILKKEELSETNKKFFKLYEKEYGNVKEMKDTLYKQVINIVKLLFYTYKKQNFSHNNNYKIDFNIRKGFQLYGIDLMFTNKLKLYLIEFNASPGLNYIGKNDINKLHADLIENIFKLAIDPIINYDNKKENKFIEILDLSD